MTCEFDNLDWGNLQTLKHFNAAQDMVGFLGCERTLLAHVFPSANTLKSFFSELFLIRFLPSLYFVFGIAQTLVVRRLWS